MLPVASDRYRMYGILVCRINQVMEGTLPEGRKDALMDAVIPLAGDIFYYVIPELGYAIRTGCLCDGQFLHKKVCPVSMPLPLPDSPCTVVCMVSYKAVWLVVMLVG